MRNNNTLLFIFVLTIQSPALGPGFQPLRPQFSTHLNFLSGSVGNLNIRILFLEWFEQLRAAQPPIITRIYTQK